MSRQALYAPSQLPEPGLLYPLGKLTRLEANHGEDNEVEWRFSPKDPAIPQVLWSVEKRAIYIPLHIPKVVRSGRGCPTGCEDVAAEFEAWTWQKQTKWEQVDLGNLPELELLGSLIAIEYYSNKHDGKYRKHIHRPVGSVGSGHAFTSNDLVSVGPSIEHTSWIYIKGPRMNATTLGLIY